MCIVLFLPFFIKHFAFYANFSLLSCPHSAKSTIRIYGEYTVYIISWRQINTVPQQFTSPSAFNWLPTAANFTLKKCSAVMACHCIHSVSVNFWLWSLITDKQMWSACAECNSEITPSNSCVIKVALMTYAISRSTRILLLFISRRFYTPVALNLTSCCLRRVTHLNVMIKLGEFVILKYMLAFT
jgi:hypothetical protein